MLMNVDVRKLIKNIALPVVMGLAAAVLNQDGMEAFKSVNQPVLTPPSWVFYTVWTILYVLMGISFYIISTAESKVKAWEVSWAQPLYYGQLIVNFLWSFFFFDRQWYLFSFVWLVLLWLLVYAMIKEFWKINKTAAYINIPYLVWLAFAALLNLGVWWMNR